MPFSSIGTATAVSGGSTPYTAPSGTWQQPVVFSTTPGALTSGVCTWHPFDVGPQAKVFTALGVAVSTAQAGGTATCYLAAYPDDTTGGAPLITGGPAVSAIATGMTATGIAVAPVAWTAQPGRYWLACLWVATATPTTVPVLADLTGGPSLWSPPVVTNPPILPGAVLGDTFVRANNATSLGSTNAGSGASQAYTTLQNNGILNNTARSYGTTSSTATGTALVSTAAAGAGWTGTYQVTIAALPVGTNGTIGLWVKSTAPNATASFYVNGQNNQYIIVSGVVSGVVPAAGDVIRMVIAASGASTYYVNGNLIATSSVGTGTGAITAGMVMVDPTNQPSVGALTNWSYSPSTTVPFTSGGVGTLAPGLSASGLTVLPTGPLTLTTNTAPVLVGALAA